MNIAKEYQFLIIIGLFIFAYVLEALVNPLEINLLTPYSYLAPQYLAKYPFTTAIIAIKSIAIFWTPLFILSFIQKAYAAKASILLVLAGLFQLYSLQEIATGAHIVPLEWSLALSVAGILLLIPTGLFFLQHSFHTMRAKLHTPTVIEQKTTA
ncbi:MAG: hypothetical protein A2804_01720 [Candidatus Pacebacteria bacterium RIFCSPHIGHO2_01_FULL_46_10]|nr:MAG: hypothetical protein A2804_01720 [Candidatus Pacebacteria bacterium RIFCSPHIGHO2_01_FULL_46_10]